MFDIYSANESGTERYALGIAGEKQIFVVGLNPSTATAEKSDTTVSKVRAVAANNQFQGFVMLNLYPLRSTDPQQLPANPSSESIAANVNNILDIAGKVNNPVFWAAWGGDISIRPYLKESLARLNEVVVELGGAWVHFGTLTKSGHPRHPSRLAYAWQFSEFDVQKYFQAIA